MSSTSPQELDKSQNSPDDIETTPQQKSSSAKRKLETDSKDVSPQIVQPKRALGLEFPMSPSTPQKSQALDTALSSPSPARKKASYGEIKDNMARFSNQLQTSCKAALYDLSLGDTKSVGFTLQTILGQSRSFVEGTLPLVNREELYLRATVQKNNSLNTYNQQLHRENNELRIKLKQFSEFESTMLKDIAFEEDQGKKEEESEQKKKKEDKETEGKEEYQGEKKVTDDDQELKSD